MVSTEVAPAAAASLVSRNPATDEIVAQFPITTPAEVSAAVGRAREAADWWAELGFEGRKIRLRRWRGLLARRVNDIAALIHRENGKPILDAIAELTLAIDHLDWASGAAGKVLGRRRVGSGMLAANVSASVEYLPYGVVGVIGPWNYPVFTPMGSIAYALSAGNAVVFKPSEYTPAVGAALVDAFTEAVPEQPVFQLVTGFGETGHALCTVGVDKLAFTGSTATGKRVMAACAENLTPVVIECGGKDPMILAADADLDAAVDAAVWGGLSNSGQTCVGVERVYVHTTIYEEFVSRLTEAAERIEPGAGGDADYGPMTMPSQIGVVARHVADALDRGGRAVVGDRDSVGERYVTPIVLVDVPEDAAAVQEETFGPTLTVTRVRDEHEAVRLANATRYGLGASVFSAQRGRAIAERLSCGCVSVNGVLSFAMVPQLPFGGVRDSGFGRIHGADGLREFAWPRSIAVRRFAAPLKVTTFRRPAGTAKVLSTFVRVRWGRSAPRGPA